MRERLYSTALKLIQEQGFEDASLRDIAKRAGVSVGLLYRYFPSKRAIVLALYDELSQEFAERAARIQGKTWRDRSLNALQASLDVLAPHRETLSALIPALVGHGEESLFAPATEFSRVRVQAVFIQAVVEASDAPAEDDAVALGRVLYMVHLAVILWWLLDKSPQQRATKNLIRALTKAAPLAALGLRIPGANAAIRLVDALCADALLADSKKESKS